MRQTQPTQHFAEPERASTGSVGLDEILGGGFDPDRVYLIEGRPGTGKTTLALQFLLEGVRRGERCLYITLSESERPPIHRSPRLSWNRRSAPRC
jgi:circadian clock protein KaiC